MTPYEIDILLWYHCRVEDHPIAADGRTRDEGLARDTIQAFLREGLLASVKETDLKARYPATYRLTDRGDAYCRALQLVPLPEARWHINWPAWTPGRAPNVVRAVDPVVGAPHGGTTRVSVSSSGCGETPEDPALTTP